MKVVFKRLLADTPKFFKKVQAAGASVFAAGIAIANIPGIPETLRSHSATAVWVGAVTVVVAQMACKNPDEIKPPTFPGNNARV